MGSTALPKNPVMNRNTSISRSLFVTAQPILKIMKNTVPVNTTMRRPYASLIGAEHNGPATNASMNKPTNMFCTSLLWTSIFSPITLAAGDTIDDAYGPNKEKNAYIASVATRCGYDQVRGLSCTEFVDSNVTRKGSAAPSFSGGSGSGHVVLPRRLLQGVNGVSMSLKWLSRISSASWTFSGKPLRVLARRYSNCAPSLASRTS